MSKHHSGRRPATKFPHLQKKLQKQELPPKTLMKSSGKGRPQSQEIAEWRFRSMGSSESLTFTGRMRSVRCAIRGIAIMIRSQHNAWIHAIATVAVVSAAAYLRISRAEWCWIVLAVIVVWTAEALNTALEFITDVASPEFHPIAGRAKDVAAGAVLISAIGAALIGALVFGPYFRERFLR